MDAIHHALRRRPAGDPATRPMDAASAGVDGDLASGSPHRVANVALAADPMSKPGPQSAGGQAGVTLIELVVALLLLALTFAIAGAGLRFLARSSDRGTELIGRHDMLSRGLDALRRDIEGLQRVVWKRGRNNE